MVLRRQAFPRATDDRADGHGDGEESRQDEGDRESCDIRHEHASRTVGREGEEDSESRRDQGPAQRAGREGVEAASEEHGHVRELEAGWSCEPLAERVARDKEGVHDDDPQGADRAAEDLHPGEETRVRAQDLPGLEVLHGSLALSIHAARGPSRHEVEARVRRHETEDRLQRVRHDGNGPEVGLPEHSHSDEHDGHAGRNPEDGHPHRHAKGLALDEGEHTGEDGDDDPRPSVGARRGVGGRDLDGRAVSQHAHRHLGHLGHDHAHGGGPHGPHEKHGAVAAVQVGPERTAGRESRGRRLDRPVEDRTAGLDVGGLDTVHEHGLGRHLNDRGPKHAREHDSPEHPDAHLPGKEQTRPEAEQAPLDTDAERSVDEEQGDLAQPIPQEAEERTEERTAREHAETALGGRVGAVQSLDGGRSDLTVYELHARIDEETLPVNSSDDDAEHTRDEEPGEERQAVRADVGASVRIHVEVAEGREDHAHEGGRTRRRAGGLDEVVLESIRPPRTARDNAENGGAQEGAQDRNVRPEPQLEHHVGVAEGDDRGNDHRHQHRPCGQLWFVLHGSLQELGPPIGRYHPKKPPLPCQSCFLVLFLSCVAKCWICLSCV